MVGAMGCLPHILFPPLDGRIRRQDGRDEGASAEDEYSADKGGSHQQAEDEEDHARPVLRLVQTSQMGAVASSNISSIF